MMNSSSGFWTMDPACASEPTHRITAKIGSFMPPRLSEKMTPGAPDREQLLSFTEEAFLKGRQFGLCQFKTTPRFLNKSYVEIYLTPKASHTFGMGTFFCIKGSNTSCVTRI